MIKILVVEDSPTVRSFLVALLEESEQVQVIGEAINGNEAVTLAERLNPDLITMDVEMPDMDGLEATRRIMAHKPTPILIVTAHAGSSRMNLVYEAMKAGALDVIAKPDASDLDQLSKWEQDFRMKVQTLALVKPHPIEP